MNISFHAGFDGLWDSIRQAPNGNESLRGQLIRAPRCGAKEGEATR